MNVKKITLAFLTLDAAICYLADRLEETKSLVRPAEEGEFGDALMNADWGSHDSIADRIFADAAELRHLAERLTIRAPDPAH